MPTALLPLAEGFEEIEAITIVDVLRRGDIQVTVAGLTSLEVVGSHQIQIMADCLLADVETLSYDLVVLPGGPGTKNLHADPRVVEILQRHNRGGMLTAAICAAPTVLSVAGLLQGKQVTGYPTIADQLDADEYISADVVVDGKVITGRAPGASVPFALKLVELLQGQAIAAQVAQAMVFNN